ncbi:meiosis-specific protein MEI4-like [Xenia sp. Carnegie-2017]|uniref:meiosis-specific protein MEI4-like n=1 Tax=Xenia sp. Carnegie-2017 TaxID=2897299 RepID=UPI001F0472A2|nr:meiosis-specific protein MEI4-like [Xenia sp. Carnegie-2017]
MKNTGKAVALEKELLLVKEELIKAKLSLSVENEDNQSITNPGNETITENVKTVDYCTPPCSSESISNEVKELEEKNDHVKFLRCMIEVLNTPDTTVLFNDVIIQRHLISTILQALLVLKENVHEMSWIETSIADLCVDGFKGLLNMKIEDDSQKIKEGVLGFARELISGIISHEKCNHKAIIDKYPKLVVRLATHEKMTTDILFELAEKIRKLSINLRSVSQDPMLMLDYIDEYQNAYHVLWCMEKILCETKETKILESLSESLDETVEKSVLHLSRSFPIYTCYLWRIRGIISTKIHTH